MTALPPAGWYPDPGDASRERWWDGKAWAEHVRQSQNAAPVAPPPAPVAPSPSTPAPHAPVSAPWVRADPAGAPTSDEPWRPSWAGQPSKIGLGRQIRAIHYRNAASFSAILFALVYAAIGFFLHFYLLGFVPILAAVGALRRHEKLAPLALAVALVPLVLLVVHRH